MSGETASGIPSTTPTLMAPAGKSAFLELPPELRLLVYEALLETLPRDFERTKSAKGRGLASPTYPVQELERGVLLYHLGAVTTARRRALSKRVSQSEAPRRRDVAQYLALFHVCKTVSTELGPLFYKIIAPFLEGLHVRSIGEVKQLGKQLEKYKLPHPQEVSLSRSTLNGEDPYILGQLLWAGILSTEQEVGIRYHYLSDFRCNEFAHVSMRLTSEGREERIFICYDKYMKLNNGADLLVKGPLTRVCWEYEGENGKWKESDRYSRLI